MTADQIRVLIGEDDPELNELYESWLSQRFDVVTARDGEEVLADLDSDVDVVLLDRKMPHMRGEEALRRINEMGVNPKVAMVTAVDPGLDVIEIGFDDYVVKPVTQDELIAIVERLHTRSSYDEKWQEFFALCSKLSLLRSETHEADRVDNEAYQQLEQRIVELRSDLDGMFHDFSDRDVYALFARTNHDGEGQFPQSHIGEDV